MITRLAPLGYVIEAKKVRDHTRFVACTDDHGHVEPFGLFGLRPVAAERSMGLTRLRAMQAEGLSLQAIAAQLNAEGVSTLSRRGHWTKGAIGKLLAEFEPAGSWDAFDGWCPAHARLDKWPARDEIDDLARANAQHRMQAGLGEERQMGVRTRAPIRHQHIPCLQARMNRLHLREVVSHKGCHNEFQEQIGQFIPAGSSCDDRSRRLIRGLGRYRRPNCFMRWRRMFRLMPRR